MTQIVGVDDLDQFTLDDMIDFMCDNINNIKKRILVGRGSEGDVYEWCINKTNCNYVVKIQHVIGNPLSRKKELEKQQEDMDLLNKHLLSPKIRAIRYCLQERVFLILMDKVKGNTLMYYLKKGDIGTHEIREFVNSVKRIHELGLYHGDLNPSNVFYNHKTGKFTFIDLREYNDYYYPYYDFFTFMYFMSDSLHNSDKNLEVFVEYMKFVKVEIFEEMRSKGITHDYCVNKIMKVVNQIIKLGDQYKSISDEDHQIDAFIDIDILLRKVGKLVENLVYNYTEDCDVHKN